MTTMAAAKKMGISRRQVSNLIAEGALQAVKVGKGYEVDEDSCSLHVRGKHRNPRTRTKVRQSALPSQCYWTDNPTAAFEVARLAQQLYYTNSKVGTEEVTTGEFYWWVHNVSIHSSEVWEDIAATAYRFLKEQRLRCRTTLTNKQRDSVPGEVGSPLYISYWVDGRPKLMTLQPNDEDQLCSVD